ncbi:alpha/beta hydrolase [Zavarzinia compransoris]|uniref:Alpha/beta hydrolase n=1 Tax=Zavarzinia compransoris TaxID=1264899 RepID=A0A317E187_9PROT|nr:alpha/beta hydrolase-fold protein [Zavarzinia compransoris]PWR20719.1 alpha/beta hydrolase [Zavarzinia compransoris]TDP44454.1 hypothetical protein DES42_107222 [Zavarzinia compransoris]
MDATRRLALGALAGLLAAPMARAQQPASPHDRASEPAEIIEHERIRRFDFGLPGGAAPWHIQVGLPAGNRPEAGWPVLYLLDGGGMFPGAWRHQEKGVGPGAVLVGIGHPGAGRLDMARRTFDFTPATAKEYLRGRDDTATGGREALLAFIADHLMPRIQAELTVDPARQSLFGHSLGGLFALFALFTRPDLFSTWVAADPSLWWNNGSQVAEAQAFLGGVRAAGGRLARPARLLVENSSGQGRGGAAHRDPARGSSIPAGQDLAKALAGVGDFAVYYRRFADLGHGGIIDPGLADTLAFIAGTVPDGVARAG